MTVEATEHDLGRAIETQRGGTASFVESTNAGGDRSRQTVWDGREKY